jgi:protein O-mannosyl-transferase
LNDSKAGWELPAHYWYPLAILLLICIGVGVFYPHLTNQRGTDDSAVYFDNHAIREDGSGWWNASLYADAYRPIWRPLTMLTYRLNWAADPGQRLAPALTNLALLIMMGIAALIVFRKIGVGVMASITAGVFVIVHPIQTESFVRLAGRSELLSNLLVLAALVTYIVYLRPARDVSTRGLVIRWGGWATIFLLALLAKETALLLPLFIIGFELTHGRSGAKRRMVALVVTSLIIIISWSALRSGVISGWPHKIKSKPAPDYVASLTDTERLQLSCYLPAHYCGMMVGAVEILPDYSSLLARPVDAPPIEIGNPRGYGVSVPSWPRVAAGLAIPLAALVLFLVYRRRLPLIAFGCWWFALSLLAILPVFAVNGVIASSRLLTFPFLGLLMVVVAALSHAFGGMNEKSIVRKVVIPGLLIVLIGIAAGHRSVGIAKVWAVPDTLMKYLQEKSPNSPEAHLYQAERALQRRDFDHAAAQIEESLGLFPRNPHALLKLAFLNAQRGQRGIATRLFSDAAVVAAEVVPGSALQGQIHMGLGTLLTEQNLPDLAIEQFKQAYAIDSMNVQATARLGILELNLHTRQDLINGIYHVDRAIELDPDNKQLGAMKEQMIRIRNIAVSTLRNSQFGDEVEDLVPIPKTESKRNE